MKEVISVAKWETGEEVRFFDITHMAQRKADQIEAHINNQINNEQYYTF